jgi:hypothetical protein
MLLNRINLVLGVFLSRVCLKQLISSKSLALNWGKLNRLLNDLCRTIFGILVSYDCLIILNKFYFVFSEEVKVVLMNFDILSDTLKLLKDFPSSLSLVDLAATFSELFNGLGEHEVRYLYQWCCNFWIR